MKRLKNMHSKWFIVLFAIIILFAGCTTNESVKKTGTQMKERQISFSDKNHSLDNNDNFSPDNRFLCYDTRGTVFNDNIGNCKTIEKIEISTGKETVLYQPESITGEQAAPGVGAVSWHPTDNKVIFIHGPLLEEVGERGYYGIRNRRGVEVSADGLGAITKVDLRDITTDRPTTPGAQRGSTHRHEYNRNGNRIGFTYDDFLNTNYDRTIGYMEANEKAPAGYTHYFAALLKPAEKDNSKPGEIEKAYGDSWVDSDGTMRAFIGKVRAENGVDYQTDLFVAEIPQSTDITTAQSGNGVEYPQPPTGIKIRRLTYNGNTEGIVRGSFDGRQIAYLQKDNSGIYQVFVIAADGSDSSVDKAKQPKQLTNFDSDASAPRWHPSNNWVFSLVDGNVAATCSKAGENFGKTVMLSNDERIRSELVVSNDGNLLAYSIMVEGDKNPTEFRQIFVMDLNWEKLNNVSTNK